MELDQINILLRKWKLLLKEGGGKKASSKNIVTAVEWSMKEGGFKKGSSKNKTTFGVWVDIHICRGGGTIST